LTNSALFRACRAANSSTNRHRAETNLDLHHPTSRHLATIAMLKCVAVRQRHLVNGYVRTTTFRKKNSRRESRLFL
jgi:hypothetical protein